MLGIDTSGERGLVGLMEENEILSEISFDAKMRHGERLFAEIENVLAAAGRESHQLQSIAVVLGPGSFTGLRIGLAAAKGLAQSLGIGVVGVPSVNLYASASAHIEAPRVVILPDRKDWVYGALYDGIDCRIELKVYSLDELLTLMNDQKDAELGLVAVGPGAEHHKEFFESNSFSVAPSEFNYASMRGVGELARDIATRDGTQALYKIEPIYFQPAMQN